ncbi:MAG: aryl-sulfate sulfotransferase, partial [Candidatus Heimdallarchaeaceae archaeon]
MKVEKIVTFVTKLLVISLVLNPTANAINHLHTKQHYNQLLEHSLHTSEINIPRNKYFNTTTNAFDTTVKATIKKVSIKDQMRIITNQNYFDGYNLFVLEERQQLGSKSNNYTLMITDMKGNLIKKRYLANSTYLGLADLSAEFINSTTILLGDSTGAVLWNIYTDEEFFLGIKGHHEYEFNPISQTFMMFSTHREIINDTTYQFDYINEYDLEGNLVWRLDTEEFINYTQWCPYHDKFGEIVDLTHSNTIFWDIEEDIIYYNARNLNTFYKIDHETKKVIWGLGEYGNFTLYDKYGHVKNNLFYHAHAVEKVDNNTYILFDNDYHNQSDEFNHQSRILEITINEDSMIANQTWDWIAPSGYFSTIWGDANRLPNGDRLGTFGTLVHPNSGGIGARVVEADENGNIVWEMNFQNIADTAYYGIYRTDRIRFKPIIKLASNTTQFPSNKKTKIEWSTWYNFRTKMKMLGSYEIYLNGTLIDSGVHIFDKFWRSNNLTVYLDKLENGVYNLTAVLFDEVGHSTTDTVFIKVTDFYVQRKGPESIELGTNNSIITWTGFTNSPVEYYLKVNGTNKKTGIWDGKIIEYDLNSLSVGSQFIQLLFYNNSILIYNDSFFAGILSPSPPLFISYPTNQNVIWSQSLSLIWEVFDYSPSS